MPASSQAPCTSTISGFGAAVALPAASSRDSDAKLSKVFMVFSFAARCGVTSIRLLVFIFVWSLVCAERLHGEHQHSIPFVLILRTPRTAKFPIGTANY